MSGIPQVARVIFLDVDGVLNTPRSWSLRATAVGERLAYEQCFDPDKVALLAQLVIRTDAAIVWSSSWRLGHTMGDLIRWMELRGFPEHLRSRFIGHTGPALDRRDAEIADWIAVYMPRRYIVLDDGNPLHDPGGIDHRLHPRNWIVVNGAHGLQRGHIDQAARILQEPDDDDAV